MPISLRKAINDHCKACGYDPLSGLGTWREQIEGCTVTRCNLHPVRPVSAKKKTTGGPIPPGLLKYKQEKALENQK